jgi:hypothetical protein
MRSQGWSPRDSSALRVKMHWPQPVHAWHDFARACMLTCTPCTAVQDAQHHRQDGAHTAEVLPAAPGEAVSAQRPC